MNEDELKHYGVLGMKWGIRKSRSGTGNKSARTYTKLLNKEERRAGSTLAVSKGLSDKAAVIREKINKRKKKGKSVLKKEAVLKILNSKISALDKKYKKHNSEIRKIIKSMPSNLGYSIIPDYPYSSSRKLSGVKDVNKKYGRKFSDRIYERIYGTVYGNRFNVYKKSEKSPRKSMKIGRRTAIQVEDDRGV